MDARYEMSKDTQLSGELVTDIQILNKYRNTIKEILIT